MSVAITKSVTATIQLWQKILKIFMDHALDNRPRFGYIITVPLGVRAHSGCDPKCGAGCGARARPSTPHPGGLGHHSLRHYDRGVGCCHCTVAGCDCVDAHSAPQQAWPEVEPGCDVPASAATERREASGFRRSRCCAFAKHSHGWMRLSALRLPFVAGSPPFRWASTNGRAEAASSSVCMQNSGAKSASRERWTIAVTLRCERERV